MTKLSKLTKLPFFTRQFAVYVTGGVLSTVIDVALLQTLLKADVGTVAATSAAFAAGLLVNYAFHAKVTFKQLSTPGTMLRYLCVVALNYLLTLVMVTQAQALLGSALAGKILSLPLVAANGFILSKYWIFK